MLPYKTGFPRFRIRDEAGDTIWLRNETSLSELALAQTPRRWLYSLSFSQVLHSVTRLFCLLINTEQLLQDKTSTMPRIIGSFACLPLEV